MAGACQRSGQPCVRHWPPAFLAATTTSRQFPLQTNLRIPRERSATRAPRFRVSAEIANTGNSPARAPDCANPRTSAGSVSITACPAALAFVNYSQAPWVYVNDKSVDGGLREFRLTTLV